MIQTRDEVAKQMAIDILKTYKSAAQTLSIISDKIDDAKKFHVEYADFNLSYFVNITPKEINFEDVV